MFFVCFVFNIKTSFIIVIQLFSLITLPIFTLHEVCTEYYFGLYEHMSEIHQTAR